MKRFAVPHTYVIIGSLILLAALATWLIPGGAYQRVEVETPVGKRMVIQHDSYAPAPAEPHGPWRAVKSVMLGMTHHDATPIIFFILIVGGAFGIITETRAVDAALAALVRRIGERKRLVIPVVMAAFSLGGATFGMCEETIPFVAMMVPLAIGLGYDSLTGASMVYVAAMTGFATAFLNPFTVGIAQGIARIPIFSGLAYRVFLWLLFTTVAIVWVMRHARRVAANPEASPMRDLDLARPDAHAEGGEPEPFSGDRMLVMLIIVAAFAAIIHGAIRLGWYIDEMVAVFLIAGIACALVTRMPLNRAADSFSRGVAGIANAALLVGLARTVVVILENAKVMDAILHGVAKIVGGLPPAVSVQCMYAFQTITNFFVPSGSGQAALTMPLMAPLSDMVGITRQTAVLAYQFGDGFTNIIIPTSAVTIAVLGMAGIPWERWARFIAPLVALYFLLGAILLVPPVLFGWQG